MRRRATTTIKSSTNWTFQVRVWQFRRLFTMYRQAASRSRSAQLGQRRLAAPGVLRPGSFVSWLRAGVGGEEWLAWRLKPTKRGRSFTPFLRTPKADRLDAFPLYSIARRRSSRLFNASRFIAAGIRPRGTAVVPGMVRRDNATTGVARRSGFFLRNSACEAAGDVLQCGLCWKGSCDPHPVLPQGGL